MSRQLALILILGTSGQIFFLEFAHKKSSGGNLKLFTKKMRGHL